MSAVGLDVLSRADGDDLDVGGEGCLALQGERGRGRS